MADGLRHDLDALTAVVASKASADDLHATRACHVALASRTDALEAGVAALEAALASRHGEMVAHVQAVAEAAGKDLAASAARLREEAAALRADVDTRAYVTALEATDESVASLSSNVSALASRVDVCLRFIEWFSEKGQAYEYNAAALERHMNALAVDNRARTVDRASTAMSLARGAYAPLVPMPPGGLGRGAGAAAAAPATVGVGGGVPGGAPTTGAAGVRIGGVTPVATA